jgi:hypothetical protein
LLSIDEYEVSAVTGWYVHLVLKRKRVLLKTLSERGAKERERDAGLDVDPLRVIINNSAFASRYQQSDYHSTLPPTSLTFSPKYLQSSSIPMQTKQVLMIDRKFVVRI